MWCVNVHVSFNYRMLHFPYDELEFLMFDWINFSPG